MLKREKKIVFKLSKDMEVGDQMQNFSTISAKIMYAGPKNTGTRGVNIIKDVFVNLWLELYLH